MKNSMVPNVKLTKKTHLNSNGKLLMLIMIFIVMNILSLKYSLMGFGVFDFFNVYFIYTLRIIFSNDGNIGILSS